MTRLQIKSITNELKPYIDLIKSQYGLEVNISASFTDVSFKINIEGKEFDTERSKMLNMNISQSLGFTQDIVGMEFEQLESKFKITGYKTANRKYPIIATQIIGKKIGQSYKFTIDQVKKCLGGDKIINRLSNLEKLV